MNTLFLLAFVAVTFVNPNTKPIDMTPDGSAQVMYITEAPVVESEITEVATETVSTTAACVPAPQLSEFADDEGTAAEKWADYGLAMRYWETLSNKCD